MMSDLYELMIPIFGKADDELRHINKMLREIVIEVS
jgi:hypothetical protein